jgi:hypothetical protein
MMYEKMNLSRCEKGSSTVTNTLNDFKINLTYGMIRPTKE